MAGAELCSGEQVAALADHIGKVQHLKLFSKKISTQFVKSTYWINCLHQQQFAKAIDLESRFWTDLLQIVRLDRPVSKSCPQQQIAIPVAKEVVPEDRLHCCTMLIVNTEIGEPVK